MSKGTILYVDDEPINLLVFKAAFRREYNLLTAGDGEEGLEQLEKSGPVDFVISDMQMPGMNGVEFLEQVKQKFPTLPCYILTGYDINPEIESAMEKGVVEAYFSKPFDQNLIDKTLSEVAKTVS